MDPAYKCCPRCSQLTTLDAQVCQRCGHQYRTNFLASQQTQTFVLPQIQVPGLGDPAANSLKARKNNKISWIALSLALVGITVILMILMLKYHTSQDQHTASYGDLPHKNVIVRDEIWLREGVPMATKDFADIELWRKTLGRRAFGGSDFAQSLNTPDDTYSQDRLIQMGRIVLLRNGTSAHVLSIDKGIASIEVMEGVNIGLKGMVSKYCLLEHNEGSKFFVPIYPKDSEPAQSVQRPDGSFYPMAGRDFPADETHPPGTVIRDGSR